MKTCGRTLMLLMVLGLVGPLRADPARDAELAERVKQLEKRVSDLEAALKHGVPAKTESENKLVGIWAVAESDRAAAVFTDLALKEGGKCDVVVRSFGPRPNATYKVVGKQLIVEASNATATETWSQCRIVSVDEKELVLEYGEGGSVRKVKYAREK
ncbi:MAG TPA: hypothetical protein VKD71_04695 [Gemmataceae bacterium]|nr:hypothetical protein [Gemmataceae bacterium]